MEIRRRPPNPTVRVENLEYAVPHREAQAKNILEENQIENELLGSLLLDYANKPSNNGSDSESNFNLIREAVFQFPVSVESNLQ